MRPIVDRNSPGMFLYAKLVLNMGKSHAKLKNILAELEKLPNGLNDAYKAQSAPFHTLQALLTIHARTDMVAYFPDFDHCLVVAKKMRSES